MMTEMRNYWEGERIRLRSPEPSDANIIFEWNFDAEMQRQLNRILFPASQEAQKEWAVKISRQSVEAHSFYFVIENKDKELVGIIHSHSCDVRVGSFKYGVSVRKEHRRQGYASEAILLLLNYYFEELRYQKVTVDIHGFNEDSAKLHEKLGFQREGCIRRVIYTAGKHCDTLVYGLTVEEFNARNSEGNTA